MKILYEATKEKQPWELNEINYKNLCKECQETNQMDDKEVGEGCDFYHECVAEVANEKLLTYIKFNAKTLDDLEATMNNLYDKFSIK